jgi:uncharacterized protein with beta-barrel porin domain
MPSRLRGWLHGSAAATLASIALICASLLVASIARAQVVTNGNDSGVGSLRDAIIFANANPGSTITFGLPANSTVTIATPLPAINANVAIDGSGSSGLTISGANTNRVFFVLSGNVSISNLTIAGGNATGGNGGSGATGGGGGMGAGGAIFVNSGTTTINNVAFANNTATGGNGGAGTGSGLTAGGGGGLGGNGGNGGTGLGGGGAGGGGGWSGGGGGGGGHNSPFATAPAGAGAGGTGPGGNGGSGGGGPVIAGDTGLPGQPGTITGSPTPAGSGGAGAQSTGGGGGGGGIGGGNGGTGTSGFGGAGGGGGNGLGVAAAGNGGSSFFGNPGGTGSAGGTGGGGGGGSYSSMGGNGGDFGGGGGGYISGGVGGYGGGGGAATAGFQGANGGFGGGNGGTSVFVAGLGGGGGGAGFGGAVFVRGDTGAQLVVADGSFTGNQVNAGAGAAGGSNGTAGGQDLFLQGGVTATFAPAASKTLIFNGTIADDGGPAIAIGIAGNPGGTVIFNAVNAYFRQTVVNAGTLDVEGSIASSNVTTVNTGAILTGAGVVGLTHINPGGVFAPGNGTASSSMTTTSDLELHPGALYLVQLNSATSSFAKVGSTAILGGATVDAVVANGSQVGKHYTILTADNISGSFDASVNGNLPANFRTSLSYDSTHAYLDITLNFSTTGGLNGNQQNVANALTNFFNTTGAIPAVFGTLTPASLTQASGELGTGSQQTTFDAMNQFIGLLTDPFIDGRGGMATSGATPFAEEGDDISAYAAKKTDRLRDPFAELSTKAVARNDLFDSRWSVWGASYGGGGSTSGNATLGSNGFTAHTFGLVAGADYRISSSTLAGFALGGGGNGFSVNGFGSGRSDLFQAGAFVRHNVGPAYILAALAYGWQDVTTDRTVTIAGIDRLRAEFNANAFLGRVEAGYRFATPWVGVTPYAAGQFTTFSAPAYAEQALVGANTFALNYAAQDVTVSRSELGGRLDRSFVLQNAILTLRGRAAWSYDNNTDRNISALFQTLPGASFVVNGAAQSHDSALTTVSAEIKWLNGFSFAANFEGEFSNVTKSYAGKGIARYVW